MVARSRRRCVRSARSHGALPASARRPRAEERAPATRRSRCRPRGGRPGPARSRRRRRARSRPGRRSPAPGTALGRDLAHAPRLLGPRRADHEAEARPAVSAPASRFASGCERLGHVLVERALAPPASVLEVARRPGCSCAVSTKSPRARRLGRAHERLEGVEAEVRIHGERVGAEGRVLREVRRGVALGGRADVAALRVEHDEHARGRAPRRSAPRARVTPRQPSASKNALCGFTAATRPAHARRGRRGRGRPPPAAVSGAAGRHRRRAGTPPEAAPGRDRCPRRADGRARARARIRAVCEGCLQGARQRSR